MAKKLEEILKAKGYTDEELTALNPMLENEKFRETLESEIANMEYLAEVGRQNSTEALRWRTEEAEPTLQKYMDEARVARAELAAKNEQLKFLQEQGLIKLEELQNAVPAKPTEAKTFDPKEHNLLTVDVLPQFADAQGQAIALVQDVAAEYQELFGKSLFSYVSPSTGKRGMVALREEAKAARSSDIYDFVSKKFNFPARREEITAKVAKEHDEKLLAQGYAKRVAEEANPSLRQPSISRLPFTAVKDSKGVMPWENAEERKAARVERVAQKALLGV